MGLSGSPVAKWYTEQLKELMERHHLTPLDIEKRTAADGYGGAVSQVSVRRILKGEIRTEPERVTLERIARCVNEPFALAFPAPSNDVQMFSVSESDERDGEGRPIYITGGHGLRVAMLIVDQRSPDYEVKGAVDALSKEIGEWLRTRKKERSKTDR